MGKFSCLEHCSLTKTWSLEERAALAHFLQEVDIKTQTDLPELQGLMILDSAEMEDSASFSFAKGDIVGFFGMLKNTKDLTSLSLKKPGTLWHLKTDDWYELKIVSPAVALQLMEDYLFVLQAKGLANPSITAAQLFH